MKPMQRKGIVRNIAWAVFSLAFAHAGQVRAQGQPAGEARPLILEAIDEGRLTSLAGNTPVIPAIKAAHDFGLLSEAASTGHLLLQLRRSPAQEQALEEFIVQLHDPRSPNYHHWLTPAEFGARFGSAGQDLEVIRAWLGSRGFEVGETYPNRLLIDFSGTAGQMREAFHTEIHSLAIGGERRLTNMSDPQIPAALAPAVAGIVGLGEFRTRPPLTTPLTARIMQTVPGSNGPSYLVTPEDIATIYNLSPLFAAGISGQGISIAAIEPTNLYSTSDWDNYRRVFGLAKYGRGSLTTIHPQGPAGSANCVDPKILADGWPSEAALDVEMITASAPSAAIVVASCDLEQIALINEINAGTRPAVLSLSYEACETNLTVAERASIYSAYQQAVTEGISVFVSTSDSGAAACAFQDGAGAASFGIGVNGWASTPYNVAVGGTDFGDYRQGTTSTYWNATNSPAYGSAKSYIPEIPWNDTCGSQLLAEAYGYKTTFGSAGLCNTGRKDLDYTLSAIAGSGGPSGCGTGVPVSEAVSGTCQGYAKPSWQSGIVGIQQDGTRDLPDVSLFAGTGVWTHTYVYCYDNPGAVANSSYPGKPCTGDPSGWATSGGTSASAPLMAGIQVLVDQNAGQLQGNPNPAYYRLAAAEYGSPNLADCDSWRGNATSKSCIFYDLTAGDNDINCTGTTDCFLPSGTMGALSTSNGAFQPSYRATAGWDFATGLGSVNGYNLVKYWACRSFPCPGSLP